MKILLITDEVWSDKLYPNNVYSNWFEEFPAEIANIYLSPGIPDNQCCSKYFQITDKMMAKSIISKYKAGIAFEQNMDTVYQKEELPDQGNATFYFFMKMIATEGIRLLRDWIWLKGNYNVKEISRFLSEFKPDIVISQRLATRKVLRLERLISGLISCPIIAFTGDDEYTLQQFRISPIYWLRRIQLRKDLRLTVSCYSKYYVLSEQQAQLYRQIFRIDTDIITKCGDFSDTFCKKELHTPIKLIYAGKLYCNRWKTLKQIKLALQKINVEETKMVLEIYTKDQVSQRRKRLISDGRNVILKPSVDAEQLKEIYANADIALQVEAFDLKNRWITKYSFSTKITDCLASSCAVMAICPVEHSGYQYLKAQNAAICIRSIKRIYSCLEKLTVKPQIISNYQRRAWECGVRSHTRAIVREKLYRDIIEICGEGVKKDEDLTN